MHTQHDNQIGLKSLLSTRSPAKARVGRVPALDHPGRALIDRPDRLQLGTLSQQLLKPALPFSGS